MSKIGRLTDRIVSAFVPKTAASAANCYTKIVCRFNCGSNIVGKVCYLQYCDGEYRTGYCDGCGGCRA